MKRSILITIALVLLITAVAEARDVLVVQGLRVKPFDDAFRGFRETCAADMTRVYLSDYPDLDLTGVVRVESPRLILAIGADALARVRMFRDIPIVYLMVLNPATFLQGNDRITGIDMNIPPEKYLDLLTSMEPQPKTIGIVYDRTTSGAMVKRVKQAAESEGIKVKTVAVSRANDVPEAVSSLKGKIDTLLMLPDSTVVTPETVEAFLLFSQDNNVPLIAFAAKYVAMGALASLDIDSVDQGRQAGEMARLILKGTHIAKISRAEARLTHLRINRSVAKKLGITFEGDDRRISVTSP